MECGQIVCVVDQFRTATVCLKWTTEDDKMLRPEELKKSMDGQSVYVLLETLTISTT